VFYRSKPQLYFQEIMDSERDSLQFSIMKPYKKDDNGQAASWLNGKSNGCTTHSCAPNVGSVTTIKITLDSTWELCVFSDLHI
jgi:hypothetical protein